MTPKLLIITSQQPGRSGQAWASPCTKAALAVPASAASRRATRSIGPDRSRPSARRAARAAAIVVSPHPQPTSSTRSPGEMAAAANKCGTSRW